MGVMKAKPKPKLSAYEQNCLDIYQTLYVLGRDTGVKLSDIKAYCDLNRITNLDEINALVHVLASMDNYICSYRSKQRQKEIEKQEKQAKKTCKRN